jgi:short-subunit dehydrogenase
VFTFGRWRKLMAHQRDKISGAVVVIAGASSGFGRGAALELGRRGAKVVLAARRAPTLEALVDEIVAAGGEALAVPTDVSVPEQVTALGDAAIARYGRIDVWVNNVGVGALGMFWEIPIEDQARVVDVNLKGVIYGAHYAVRQFIAQGEGVLINVGSIDSEVPLALQTTYAATKAAVRSISRSLREELRLAGHDGIKIATIMPWAVDTPWWYHAANYTGHLPRMAAMDDPQIVVDAIVDACLNPKIEMPAGSKAHAANISHHLAPSMTEHMSADIAAKESEKAWPQPATHGAIYDPMEGTESVDGGLRERMRAEDVAKNGRKTAASSG